jgi:hypothetical protein
MYGAYVLTMHPSLRVRMDILFAHNKTKLGMIPVFRGQKKESQAKGAGREVRS